jgi:hypothetical protein
VVNPRTFYPLDAIRKRSDLLAAAIGEKRLVGPAGSTRESQLRIDAGEISDLVSEKLSAGG